MNRGYSYTKNNTVLYKWQITDIRSYMKEAPDSYDYIHVLESSEFSSGAKIEDKWQIDLAFNNDPAFTDDDKHIDFIIHNNSDHDITAHVDLFIANPNGECALHLENFSVEFNSDKYESGIPDGVIMHADLLKNNSELIPDDVLTLCVKITVTDDEIIMPFERLLEPSKSDMAIDYKELYKSKAFSDVTIIADDKKILAHKIILMARCPVLVTMFNHELIEKKTSQITIPNINFEILEKLLEYIYTDEVSNLDKVAADLLKAADTYQIKLLKKRCEESLCGSLNLDNIIQTMVLADLYNAENLLEYVTKCIIADVLNVIETESFKDYEKVNPSLGLKLFRKLAVEQYNIQTKIFHLTSKD